MAKMPGAEWLGPHHDNGTMTRYDVYCVHTIAGNPPAHAAHFSIWSDGKIGQSRDTVFRSAANFEGNHRVIAGESDDTGPPFPDWNHSDGKAVPAFTPEQIEAHARTAAWCYKEHGIPLVACPDSKPGSRGIAYHRQGIDGNFASAGYKYPGRVSGGERWSTHFGKVCPGDRRIAQMPLIIKRARVLAGLEDDDMSDAQYQRLMEAIADVKDDLTRPLGYTIDGVADEATPRQVWTRAYVGTVKANATLQQQGGVLAQIASMVKNDEGLPSEEVLQRIEAAIENAVVDVDITVDDRTDAPT